MFKESLDKVLRFSENKNIIIVCAGKIGQEIAVALIEHNYNIISFFDNNESLNGLTVYGIPVCKPVLCGQNDNVVYIIATASDFIRFKLKKQLIGLGINQSDIACYYPYRCPDFNSELSPDEYKSEFEIMYSEVFGKPMNWENPSTYNEKINWEKFNITDERRVRLSDKRLAREWVADKIGNKHLTEHYGYWKRTKDIDLDKLPERFVLKTNNGSSRNILVHDKSTADFNEIFDKLEYWLNSNYMFQTFEMHYGLVEPCILAEEYIEGLAETLYDYNIYCFHGEPEYIWCIKGSHRPGCTATFYNKKWERQPFSFGYPLDIYPALKPDKLDEMLNLTKVLCEGFDHVRVDWYILPDGRILFGEMTFMSWGGVQRFCPEKYDMVFGNLI